MDPLYSALETMKDLMCLQFYEGHSSEEEAKYYLECNNYDIKKALEQFKEDLRFEEGVYK